MVKTIAKLLIVGLFVIGTLACGGGSNNETGNDPPGEDQKPKLVAVEISGPSTLDENSSADFSASALFDDGTTKIVTALCVWQVSPDLAAVDSGKLTVGELAEDQTVVISARYTENGIAKETEKEVTLQNVEETALLNGLFLTGDIIINENSSSAYTAKATYDNGHSKIVTTSCVWQLDPPISTATIENGNLAVGEMASTQQTRVVATYKEGGIEKSASLLISIENQGSEPGPEPEIKLENLAISGLSEIADKSLVQYTATANFSDGTSQTVSPKWTCNRSDIAAINEQGLLAVGNLASNANILITAEYTRDGIKKTASLSISIKNIFQVHGLNFGPFTGGLNPDRGDTVTSGHTRTLIKGIHPYSEWLRTFSVSLGVEQAARIAQEYGMNTIIGAWLSNNAEKNKQEIATLIELARDGYVDIAVIGSETLYRNELTAAQLIAYIRQFKQAVPEVPVTTADTYDELLARPTVIAECDLVFANFYPFWEGIKVDLAVAHMNYWYNQVAEAYPDKEIVVSESGWPSAGKAWNRAVPSLENAAFYFCNTVSWAEDENIKVFHFEAYDEDYKRANEGEVGAHWGIFYANGTLKPGMQEMFDGKRMGDNWSCEWPIDGEGTPVVKVTYLPPLLSFNNLEGEVAHVAPKEYKVACYIYVGGKWWIKPHYSETTAINCDGTFTIDITTGGVDQTATQIVLYVVPADYTVSNTYNATELSNHSVAEIKLTR